MSTATRPIRQGLPRVPGGSPWPEAGTVAVPETVIAAPAETQAPVEPAVVESAAVESAPIQPAEPVAPEPVVEARTSSTELTVEAPASNTAIRQGLPRVPGGAPWPPAGTAISAVVTPSAAVSEPEPTLIEAPASATASEPSASAASAAVPEKAVAPRGELRADVRQGLPRTVGGSPWPPLDAFRAVAPAAVQEAAPPAAAPEVPAPAQNEAVASQTELPPAEPQKSEVSAAPVAAPAPVAQPAPVQPKIEQSAAPVQRPAAASAPKAPAAPVSKKEPARHGPLTTKQWVLAGIFGAFSALGMATAIVLLARWIVGFDAVSGFIAQYPGEYHLPESAPVGVPAWLAWNHFFNFFLMVLIIRTGMQVRHQKKPPAYWSSKRSPKVSINLWLHQSLDALWIINGLAFVVLLFATGHWMRIVPTSWEVFPNAVSAALQYLTLDWPTENGWVNYNSLQQLAYFTTVFIAAPLAAATGFRLSAFWPKNAAGLTKRYPIEVARALHFPTMLYFVFFILVHVILVFSTGALRNLNHMYAAQGSTDPTVYADNWLGLILFAVSLLVIGGAWLACRPMVLSMIAGVFGKVSSR